MSMRYLMRAGVALAAAAALAFSAAFGAALWQLWRHPLALETRLENGARTWRGGGLAWELRARDGTFEQLRVRRLPGAAGGEGTSGRS